MLVWDSLTLHLRGMGLGLNEGIGQEVASFNSLAILIDGIVNGWVKVLEVFNKEILYLLSWSQF